MIEAGLFFHPAVWFVSRRVSVERENCCDDAVLAAGWPRVAYADALVRMAELCDAARAAAIPSPAVLSAEGGGQSQLKRRVLRLLGDDRATRVRLPRAAAAVIVVLLLGLAALPAVVRSWSGPRVDEARAAESGEVETVKAAARDNAPVVAPPMHGTWPQFGGTSHRNNVADGENLPQAWDIRTGANIKWAAKLGTNTYATPVIHGGRVFIGTNNGAGYIRRYPADVDISCLVCFDEATGRFLWQYSSEKLPTGRVHDWPQQGLCSTPLAEGDRLWFVSNRGEVVCLDTEGFSDGENDGPVKDEPRGENEADVVWRYDMMRLLGVFPHNQFCCSVTAAGDVLLVGTSNGVDERHTDPPAPAAPSFIALDRRSGKLLWKDASPGRNILHGQWSSPAYGVFEGVPQAIFAGGDGWVYSFDLRAIREGETKMLWWFDANPKKSVWNLGGRGTRNNILAAPVIYNSRVYIAVGQDPEHGEGDGHLWCIDPTRRGDISSELVYNGRDPKTPIAHKRRQACEEDKGDFVGENPNSGVVWHYDRFDHDGDGEYDFEEVMHRTLGSVAIADDLLIVNDSSGLLHCLDAGTGRPHWTYDLLAFTWSTPLIADGRIYVGDEDGDVAVVELSKKFKLLAEVRMDNCVYTTPVCVGDTLYIANKTHLYAIRADKGQAPAAGRGARASLPRRLRLKWKLPFEGESFAGAPAVAGGTVFLAGESGRVYALEAAGGRRRWVYETKSSFQAAPAVQKGWVFVGDLDGRFHCLGAETGESVWKFDADGAITAAAALADQDVLFATETGTLYALDLCSGEERWRLSLGDQLQSTPTIAGDAVIVGGCDGRLHVIDLKTGREKKAAELSGPTCAAATVHGGRAFIGDEEGRMHCIDLATDRPLWQYDDGRSIRGAAASDGERVLFGTHGKRLVCLDAARGKVRWISAARGRIDAAPVLAGDRVFSAAADGRLTAHDLTTGETLWQFEADASLAAPPTITSALLLLADGAGNVYCFGG